MKHAIKNQFTDDVLFECEVPDDVESGLRTRYVLKKAVAARANLVDANLARANLADANLARANLADANLAGANLARANLADANLARANLARANLARANLVDAYLADAYLARADLAGANLADAYLAGADLADANLADANLVDANLADAYLARADLAGANLAGANLADANLADAVGAELAISQTRILPEGDLIGWKKCKGGVLVKLRIPADAKRSHALGRKCRAEFADVLEVVGAEVAVAVSSHDRKTEYRVGQRVVPDSFSDDWQQECAPGIHFFITRIEAENY